MDILSNGSKWIIEDIKNGEAKFPVKITLIIDGKEIIWLITACQFRKTKSDFINRRPKKIVELRGRDITAAELVERDLRNRYWRLALPGLLALGSTHQLNRSVTGLTKSVERILRIIAKTRLEGEGIDDVNQQLGKMGNSLQAVRKLFGDLRQIAAGDRFENLRESLKFEKLRCENLKLRLTEATGEQAANKDVQVNYSFSENVTVLANSGLLVMALTELIQNAIRHSPPMGSVDVKIVESVDVGDRKFRLISVSNSGEIKPRAQARLFEPFFTTDEFGTGLGLPLAKAIVEDIHCGEIFCPKEKKGVVSVNCKLFI